MSRGECHRLLAWGTRGWACQQKPLLARVPSLSNGAGGRALSVGGGVLGGIATFALVTLGWGLFVMPIDRFALMMGQLL